MAEHPGTTNLLSGDDIGGNTQDSLGAPTSPNNNHDSSLSGHGPDCVTPRCLPLDQEDEYQQWRRGFAEIDRYFSYPSQGHSRSDNDLQTATVSGNALTAYSHTQAEVATVPDEVDADGESYTEELGTQNPDAQNHDNPQYMTAENNAGGCLTGSGIEPSYFNSSEPPQYHFDESIAGLTGHLDDFDSYDFRQIGLHAHQADIGSIPPSLQREYLSGYGSSVKHYTPTKHHEVVQSGEALVSVPRAVQAPFSLYDPAPMASVMMQASPIQASASTPHLFSELTSSSHISNPSFGPMRYNVAGSGKAGSPELDPHFQATAVQQFGGQNSSMTLANNVSIYPASSLRQMSPDNQTSQLGQFSSAPIEDNDQSYPTGGTQTWNSARAQLNRGPLLGMHSSMMVPQDSSTLSPTAGTQTWNSPQPPSNRTSPENHSAVMGPTEPSTSNPTADLSGIPASTTENINQSMNENLGNEAIAAQDITDAPGTVNEETYTNIFPDWNAVVAYENQRDHRPDYDGDQTVPQTASEHHIYVRQIAQAICDTSNTRDYPPGSAERGLKAPQAYSNFTNKKYKAEQIQVLAWKVLMRCKEKQRNGYLVPGYQRTRKPVIHATFQGLVDEICTSLREQKTICKRLLDAEFFNEFIDNPGAQLKRAAQNKRLNENKAVHIKVGRELIEGASKDRAKGPAPAVGGNAEGGEEPVSDAEGVEGGLGEGNGGLPSLTEEPQGIDPAILPLAPQPVQGSGPRGQAPAWGATAHGGVAGPVPMMGLDQHTSLGGPIAEGAGAQPQLGRGKRGRVARGGSEEKEPRGGKRRCL